MFKIKKEKLADLERCYAVNAFEHEGRTHFVSGSEGRFGAYLFREPDFEPVPIWSEPGGAMSIAPHDGGFLSIQNFFPIYDSKEAGIFHTTGSNDYSGPWETHKVLDIPYCHRIEKINSIPNTFIAASLCEDKAEKEDWSKPGKVYACEIPQDHASTWKKQILLEGLTHNHGMHVNMHHGEEQIFIGADEGLFQLITPPSGTSSEWNSRQIFDFPVSDLWISDITGNGKYEIGTIEPFHGNVFRLYQHGDGTWNRVLELPMAFGHVVWIGKILDQAAILLGSRAENKNLSLHLIEDLDTFKTRELVLEAGAGPAQANVVEKDGVCRIFSSNHALNEVSLYTLSR